MKTVSKFSFTRVYLMYGFCMAVLLLAVYCMVRLDIETRTSFGSSMSLAYTGLIFLAISLFYLYFNQKYLSTILVSDDSIIIKNLFKKHAYSAKDIQSIDLFKRKNLGMLTSQRKSNGINIEVIGNDQSFFLPDIYYSNAPEVKKALYENFTPLICNQATYENNIGINPIPIYSDSGFQKFSGYFIFSGSIISLILAYVFLLFFLPESSLNFLVFMNLLFLTFFILSFVFTANYFILSNKQLIVKNQLLWMKSIVYETNNIRSVSIEKFGSYALRINTKDFHSRLFQAGPLTNKTWRKLVAQLRELGIEVQSDI